MPLNTPCMFPLYHIFPICYGDFGGICTPICLGVHLSGISVSVGTSSCLSVHNSQTRWSPSLWVTSSLDWMSMDVCYASYCCSFVVFSLSQASTTMGMTTTPPLTVVFSSTSPLLSVVTMAPSLMGLPATSVKCVLVLT